MLLTQRHPRPQSAYTDARCAACGECSGRCGTALGLMAAYRASAFPALGITLERALAEPALRRALARGRTAGGCDMSTRDCITADELARIAAGADITLVGSRGGYGVAIGPAQRARWLHSSNGTFRLFQRADQAIEFLRAAGVRRITLDIQGGVPQ